MSTAKDELRNAMRRRRAALPEHERAAAGERLARHLLDHPLVRPLDPGTVLVPVAHRGEIPTAPLAARLEAEGWTIVRPRTDPAHVRMDVVAWPTGAPLRPGYADIPEPPADAPSLPPYALRVVLVPGLAFGSDGHRLGSGKGYFDRFFAQMAPHRRPVTIGIGYALQLVDRVPAESHDVPLDGLQLGDRSIVCRRVT